MIALIFRSSSCSSQSRDAPGRSTRSGIDIGEPNVGPDERAQLAVADKVGEVRRHRPPESSVSMDSAARRCRWAGDRLADAR